jgi:hypothetical protein
MPQTDEAAHAQDGSVGEAARFRGSPFYAALRRALARRGARPEELCDCDDPASRRLLSEYGAMFVGADGVRVPSVLTFGSEEEVEQFQREAEPRAAEIGGFNVELQPAALDALVAACDDARREGLSITPRGAVAARRGYADTVRLWDSRVRPALEHWLGAQLIADVEADRLRALAPAEQLSEVLRLEARGLFFSKDWTKTILQSVAAPGASQHLAMLAFDAAEFTDARVREIFFRHGWFQTVLSDLPHFTFLGVREKDLPTLGLRRVEECGQSFWVPDLG